MYFPYLRGKQFELIALKEISDLLAKSRSKISPIIEPVKESSTLRNALQSLKKKGINFNVVINPKVGDLQNSTNSILSLLDKELAGYTNFQLAVILSGKENHKQIISSLQKFPSLLHGLSLIHCGVDDNIKKIIEEYEAIAEVKYNINYLGKTNQRYHRNFKTETLVGLDDYFVAQKKNADYKPIDESDFSEEHNFYKGEGHSGFSDFLTIGDNYTEGGFLPYAIAIHLSYANASNKIKVKHFVSDSNDDNSDIAGKFDEALTKLVTWCDSKKIKTGAVDVFRELHRTGHFPGLGSVKKLSVLNHIELVLKLI